MYANYINHCGFTSCLGDFTSDMSVCRTKWQHDFSHEENKESGHWRRGLVARRERVGRVTRLGDIDKLIYDQRPCARCRNARQQGI